MKQTQSTDKRGPQIPVWNWRDAIRKSSMSTGAKCLCYSIANYLNDAGGYAYPPVKDLMTDMNCSNTTVARCVKEAADAGYLYVQRMHNAAGHLYGTHYHPRFPEGATLAVPNIEPKKSKRSQSVNQDEKSSSRCRSPNEESSSRESLSENLAGLSEDLGRLDEESSRHNSPNKDPNNKIPPTPKMGASEGILKSLEGRGRRPKRISREEREAARAAKYAEEWEASEKAMAAAVAAARARAAQQAEERGNGRR